MRAGSCPVLTQVSRPATTSHCGSHWRAAGQGESLSCVDEVASPGHGSPVDRPEEFEAHYFFVTRVGHWEELWCSKQTFRHGLAYFQVTKNPNIPFSGAFLLGHHISFYSGSWNTRALYNIFKWGVPISLVYVPIPQGQCVGYFCGLTEISLTMATEHTFLRQTKKKNPQTLEFKVACSCSCNFYFSDPEENLSLIFLPPGNCHLYWSGSSSRGELSCSGSWEGKMGQLSFGSGNPGLGPRVQ